MERIQKVIANSGYCSRRKAEELIKEGKISVNGKTITEMGYHVDSKDIISIDGEIITNDEDKVYYLLNKPRGVVTTTSDDKKRKTVIDLINEKRRIYPVGRLDYDTTGVLLLTNDGTLANILTHPRNNVLKVYIAKIKGIITKEDLIKLRKGIVIDNRKTSPAIARLKRIDKKNNTSIVELTIHEGRNHQVKKMFESLHYSVIKLKRERFAFLTVDGLLSGEYRKLQIKEVKKLYSIAKNRD